MFSCYLPRYDQQESILTEQAKEERRNPVLPKLKEFLEGKEILHTCQPWSDDQEPIKFKIIHYFLLLLGR